MRLLNLDPTIPSLNMTFLAKSIVPNTQGDTMIPEIPIEDHHIIEQEEKTRRKLVTHTVIVMILPDQTQNSRTKEWLERIYLK
jgi:hypothetical protein